MDTNGKNAIFFKLTDITTTIDQVRLINLVNSKVKLWNGYRLWYINVGLREKILFGLEWCETDLCYVELKKMQRDG